MLMIKGKCLGVGEHQRGKGDNQWTVTVLGISEKKNDLFHTDIVTEVQLSSDQLKNGMLKKLGDLKGQEITVEVWQKINAKDSRAFVNTYLVGLVG